RVVQARDAAGMGSRLCGAGGVARRVGAAQRVTVPTHSRPAGAMLPGQSTWSPTCWAAGAAAASPFQLATNLYCEKLQRERPGQAAVSSTRIFPAFSGPGRAPSPAATEYARAGETGSTCRPAPAATAYAHAPSDHAYKPRRRCEMARRDPGTDRSRARAGGNGLMALPAKLP